MTIAATAAGRAATDATESRLSCSRLGALERDLMRGQSQTVCFGEFSQTRTRRFEDHPNGSDARFASLRAVDLGETPERELEPD